MMYDEPLDLCAMNYYGSAYCFQDTSGVYPEHTIQQA